MPQAIPAVVSIAASYAASLYFSNKLVVALIALAAGLTSSYLLLKKPKLPSIPPEQIKTTIREPAPFRNYILGQRVVGCTEIFKATRGTGTGEDEHEWLDWVQVIADHPVEAIERIYINGEEVLFDLDGNVRDLQYFASRTAQGGIDKANLDVSKILGGNEPRNHDINRQASIQNRYKWDEAKGDKGHFAHIEFRLDGRSAAFPGLDKYRKWNSATDKATGCALMYFRAKWDQEVYPNGEPIITLEVKGCNSIYDPRTGATGWSNNAALLIAWLLANFPNLNVRKIDQAALIDAANVCDQRVGNVRDRRGRLIQWVRYQMNAYIRLDQDIQNILAECANTIGGDIFYSHIGGWRIEPGRARTPTETIEESDLIGAVSVQPKIPIDYRSNTLLPHFVSPANEYELTSLEQVRNPLWVRDDGRELIEQVDYLFVTSLEQAAQLARQHLATRRLETEVSVSVRDFELGMSLYAGAAVRFSYAPLGIEMGTFVVLSWKPVSDGDNLVFELRLKHHDAAAYVPSTDWRDYRIVPPYRGDLVDARYVPAVMGLYASSGNDQIEVYQDGAINHRMEIGWQVSASPYADHAEVEVFDVGPGHRVRKAAFSVAQGLAGGHVDQVEGGKTYEISVRYVNSLGVRGEASVLVHEVEPDTRHPETPTSLELSQEANHLVGLISAPADRDVRAVHVKYLVATTLTSEDEMAEIATDDEWDAARDAGIVEISQRGVNQPQVRFEFVARESGRYRVAVRFVDTAGNESGLISSQIVFKLDDSSVLTQLQAPMWDGELDGFIRHGGALLPKGVKAGDAVSVREWMTTFAGPQKPDDVAAQTEETFDWTAAEADVEGLVGRQTGFTIRSSTAHDYPRLGATSDLRLDTPIDGTFNRFRFSFAIGNLPNTWGWSDMLVRRGLTGGARGDIPQDETRSVICRLTAPNGEQFTVLLRLIDDLTNDNPDNPQADEPYRWEPTGDSFFDDHPTNISSDNLFSLGTWLRSLPADQYRVNLPPSARNWNLDFALVENSAGWRQDGENVVRGENTDAIPGETEISFTGSITRFRQPLELEIIRRHTIERLPYADAASYDPAQPPPSLDRGNFERVGQDDANISHDYLGLDVVRINFEEFDFADDAEGLVGKKTGKALAYQDASFTSGGIQYREYTLTNDDIFDDGGFGGPTSNRFFLINGGESVSISFRYSVGEVFADIENRSFVVRLRRGNDISTVILPMSEATQVEPLRLRFRSWLVDNLASLLGTLPQPPSDAASVPDTLDFAIVENSAGWMQDGTRVIRELPEPTTLDPNADIAASNAPQDIRIGSLVAFQPRIKQRINQGNPGGMIIREAGYTIDRS